MTDKKTEELNEAELDQVTGGAGGKGLIAHELTHVQQQGGKGYIGETEKNLDLGADGKPSVKSFTKSGGGSSI
tara:strand:+ start:1881 stop:2099 length:219 start_codon:yes stop_codon:yes gene_type:complete